MLEECLTVSLSTQKHTGHNGIAVRQQLTARLITEIIPIILTEEGRISGRQLSEISLIRLAELR